jgi:hypothetical protein
MISQWWSWLLVAVGSTGLIIVGRRVWWGWLVLFVNESLWIAYSLITKQYGFIVGATIYKIVYWNNIRLWRSV